jgi:hypothetical protein
MNLKAQPSNDYNRPIYGFRGVFTLTPETAVPYFASLMTIRRMASELKTHEQVAPALEQTYNLKELYQREIDVDRIDREIVNNFLQDPGKLKFFSSLTVVLLPKDKDGRILPDFPGVDESGPAVPCEGDTGFDEEFKGFPSLNFGGVQFIESQAHGLSRLRWDDTRIDAVAVDGQHRLTAIRRWFDNCKNKSLNANEEQTVIPVIFLLLSPKAGFSKGLNHASKGIKTIAREIFTDLNKNAKTVDKATEIILDDRSLISLCVRELVTEETCQEQPNRLPLSLVRWREANNRFDKDYYLNSLVHLNLVVDSILDLPIPKSGMAIGEVKAFIGDVGRKLGNPETGQLTDDDGTTLLQYYRDNFLDSDDESQAVAPLTGVPGNFMAAAVRGFRERYVPWMSRLFMELRPYKQLLDYARQNNLIIGLFSQYHAQPKSHQTALKTLLEKTHGYAWENEHIKKHVKQIESIKSPLGIEKCEDWLFKTLFQKAVLQLGKAVCINTAEKDRERVGTIDDLIAFLNRIHETGILETHAALTGHSKLLWTFIDLNPVTPNIQVSAASETRIFALLTILYLAERYEVFMKNEGHANWPSLDTAERGDLILKRFRQLQTEQFWPLLKNGRENVADLVLQLFRKNSHLINGVEKKEMIPEQEQDRIAKQRLSAIIQLVLAPPNGLHQGVIDPEATGAPSEEQI